MKTVPRRGNLANYVSVAVACSKRECQLDWLRPLPRLIVRRFICIEGLRYYCWREKKLKEVRVGRASLFSSFLFTCMSEPNFRRAVLDDDLRN